MALSKYPPRPTSPLEFEFFERILIDMFETVAGTYVNGCVQLDHPLKGVPENSRVELQVNVSSKIEQLKKAVGILPDEDAAEITQIINQEFGRIDPNDWK